MVIATYWDDRPSMDPEVQWGNTHGVQFRGQVSLGRKYLEPGFSCVQSLGLKHKGVQNGTFKIPGIFTVSLVSFMIYSWLHPNKKSNSTSGFSPEKKHQKKTPHCSRVEAPKDGMASVLDAQGGRLGDLATWMERTMSGRSGSSWFSVSFL